MISVIMPVYNAEKYLRESIESILNQTYKNFELIIINDGSTDNSIKIIKKYEFLDLRIKVINRENKGLIYSLNEGIKIAKGTYIVRMDADDISHKDRLDEQKKYIEKYNIDILGSYIQCIGEDDGKLENENWFNKKLHKDNLLERMMINPVIAHPSVMMKKDIFIKLIGYRSRYKAIEDYDLWIRAMKSGFIISNIPKQLLSYRLHKNQKSQKDRNIVLRERIECKFEHYKEHFKNKKIFIWGTGVGGKTTYNVLTKNEVIISGWIDNQKKGEFKSINIINNINSVSKKDSYILIANSYNNYECYDILKKKGYKNYLIVI